MPLLNCLKAIPLGLALLVACNSADDDPRPVLQEARFKGLTDSIAQFPDNDSLYLERALLLSQSNRHELATEDYQKAWELAPAEPTALLLVSNLMLVNKPARAVELLKEGSRRWPQNTEFNRRLSEVYAQTGNAVEALQQFDLLLQRDSLNFETWMEKGGLLVRLGDTAGAIAALEKSYRLQQINYNGFTLANMYASTKDPRTVGFCDHLIAKDSSNTQPEPYFIKGTYYSDTHQYALALEQFDEAIKRDWTFTDAYLEKGIVYYEQQLFDKALEVFTFTTTVAKTSPDAWFWIGRCQEAKGNNALAIENYKKALALDKEFVEAAQRIKKLSN